MYDCEYLMLLILYNEFAELTLGMSASYICFYNEEEVKPC